MAPLLGDHATPVPSAYDLPPSVEELCDERDRALRRIRRLRDELEATQRRLEAVEDDIAALTNPTQETTP